MLCNTAINSSNINHSGRRQSKTGTRTSNEKFQENGTSIVHLRLQYFQDGITSKTKRQVRVPSEREALKIKPVLLRISATPCVGKSLPRVYARDTAQRIRKHKFLRTRKHILSHAVQLR